MARIGDAIIVIVIGAEDLLVTGNSLSEITEVREKMKKRSVLIDQGPLEYYLGVEATKLDENTLKSQGISTKFLR